MQLGEPSPFTCPECHGNLTRLKDAGIIRFRCHTGHAYSLQSLIDEVSTGVENDLWSAIRSLEESALLLEHFARHLEEAGQEDGRTVMLRQKRDNAEKRVALLRDIAMRQEQINPEAPRVEKSQDHD
jgi:two-component system chemotaxis response regulator CheB